MPSTNAANGRKYRISHSLLESFHIAQVRRIRTGLLRRMCASLLSSKDIGTVQNEAAMVATYAVEMFVEKMVYESHDNAKKRGRNTVKYEDLAEVRASHSNMSFLNTLIP